MSVDKRTIRQAMREKRRGLSVEEAAAAGVAIWEALRAFRPYQEARSLLGYVDHENEVPTQPILDDAVRTGRLVYLPRAQDPVGWGRWAPGEALVAGPGGTLQPGSLTTEPPKAPAVALVPLVAWDTSGTRLGRGGGCYDKLLAQLDAMIVRVGLAYAFQQVSMVPGDPWDIPLHVVITERGIVRCREGWGAERLGIQKGGLTLE